MRIPALRSAIADDLSQHGDAERLFGTVTLALCEARELYRTAESDRIPDSSQTTQAYRDVEGLEHDLKPFSECSRALLRCAGAGE